MFRQAGSKLFAARLHLEDSPVMEVKNVPQDPTNVTGFRGKASVDGPGNPGWARRLPRAGEVKASFARLGACGKFDLRDVPSARRIAQVAPRERQAANGHITSNSSLCIVVAWLLTQSLIESEAISVRS